MAAGEVPSRRGVMRHRINGAFYETPVCGVPLLFCAQAFPAHVHANTRKCNRPLCSGRKKRMIDETPYSRTTSAVSRSIVHKGGQISTINDPFLPGHVVSTIVSLHLYTFRFIFCFVSPSPWPGYALVAMTDPRTYLHRALPPAVTPASSLGPSLFEDREFIIHRNGSSDR